MSHGTADLEQNIMHMMNALKLLEGGGLEPDNSDSLAKEEELKSEALKAALLTDTMPSDSKEDLAFPPGLEGILSGLANAKRHSQENPQEATEMLPKKVPLPSASRGMPAVFQAHKVPTHSTAAGDGLGETASKKASNKLQKAAPPGASPQTGKKFCVYCGSQVDPDFLTARFCAYCGAEHASTTDMTPGSPGPSPGSSKPRRGPRTAAAAGPGLTSGHLAAWHAYQMLTAQRFQYQYHQSLAWQGLLAEGYGERDEGEWSETPPGSFSTMYSSASLPESHENSSSDWPDMGVAW